MMACKTKLHAALFFGFLSLLSAPLTLRAQPSAVRLHVAYVAISGTQAALWMGQEGGLFRKYGLDVSLVYIAGAAQVIQTMLAGDIQIAAAAPSGVVSVVLGGGDLVTVAGMVNIPAFYLAVRPEINSIQDLKGRPVGVTRFGASTDFTMRYLLRRAGLEPQKDVPILQMGGQPEMAVGLETGRIFAATAVPPALVRMERAGAKVLVTPRSIGFRFPHVGVVVRKSFLTAQRETVKNFLRGYGEGVALLYRDKERSKKGIGRYIRSEDAGVLEATWQYAVDTIERVPYPDPEGFKVVLEELARTRPETAKAKPEQFIDDSLIRELEAEGFFKKLSR
ncbi:MAG: ABC transporter substrate-binding protein [Deltaproteobacteria bacterium]|nr:ABC transporter substrate-binding protein [Deltaproteobacteria bacterium]